MANTPADIVRTWQEAASNRQIDALLALSDPDIAIVGPRGTARGHQVLREWIERAGLSLETRRVFARGEVVVVEQHAVWRSMESNEIVGESDIASRFLVVDDRVAEYARHDSLADALADAGISDIS
jgi:hypothetical protein